MICACGKGGCSDNMSAQRIDASTSRRTNLMATRFRRTTLMILSGVLCTTAGWAQEKSATKPGTDASSAPLVPRATVKAEKGRLVASVTVKGTVEGEATTEVSVRLKAWTGPLVVEKAVEHGAQVKKDDVLITFDPEKITQLVRSAREERELAQLAIKLAELDLPLLKQHLPLDMQAAEREKKQTADDLQRFLKIEKPRQIEEAQFAVKSGEFNVESAKDELSQLEKMYKDKDLTEETERMILKRYKHSLENAEFYLQGTRQRTERALTIDVPRKEESAQLAATKADLAWEK